VESVIVNALRKRLDKLERETGRAGKLYVVEGPDGCDLGKAKAELGLQLQAADTLVYLRDLCSDGYGASSPILLSAEAAGWALVGTYWRVSSLGRVM
jgi:hypothetical protein